MTWIAMRILIIGLILLPGTSTAMAGTAPQDRLNEAQQALAAGNYDTSFTLYERMAEEYRDPLAYFNLALYYRNGWGRQSDPKAACGFFGKAAEGGIPAAAHFYAECIEQGVAEPADPERAAVWYEKAAAWGHLISYCALARLYMTGTGVPKDPAKGVMLCSKGAGNNTSAQIQMGRYYLEGDAGIRNPQEAYQWFSMAARRNVAEAQYLLAMMEKDGSGRPRSVEKALPWFEAAASQGYLPAYLPSAELYYSAPVDPQTKKPYAEHLAKSYLWLSATIRRSNSRVDRGRATEMMKDILLIMPNTWIPSLDEKVEAHLKEVGGITAVNP